MGMVLVPLSALNYCSIFDAVVIGYWVLQPSCLFFEPKVVAQQELESCISL